MADQPAVNTQLPEDEDEAFRCTSATKWSPSLIDAIFARIEAIGADTAMRRGGDGTAYIHPVASEAIPAGFPVGLAYDEAGPKVVKLTAAAIAAGASFAGFAVEACGLGAHCKVAHSGFISKGLLKTESRTQVGDTTIRYALLKEDADGTVYLAARSKLSDGAFVGFVTSNGDVYVAPWLNPAPLAGREKTQRITADTDTIDEGVTVAFVDTDSGGASYTITMPPTPFDGQRVTVVDSGDNATNANIDLVPGAGHAMSFTAISIDGQSATFIFSSAHAKWFAVGQYGL